MATTKRPYPDDEAHTNQCQGATKRFEHGSYWEQHRGPQQALNLASTHTFMESSQTQCPVSQFTSPGGNVPHQNLETITADICFGSVLLPFIQFDSVTFGIIPRTSY